MATERSDKSATYLRKLSQLGMERVGREITSVDNAWLQGPVAGESCVTEDYFVRLAEQQQVPIVKNNGKGLLQNFNNQLESEHFDPTAVDPEIVSFYENTSNYKLGLNVRWKRFYKALASMSRVAYTRRVQQLNIPTKNTLNGTIKSDIYALQNPKGDPITGWVRKNTDTGDLVFSGAYTTSFVPNKPDIKQVKVSFPLPRRNVTVFLQPENRENGGFRLVSQGDNFGDSGLYVVSPQSNDILSAVYLPSLTQVLDVERSRDGTLHARHDFSYRRNPILTLDYDISPKQATEIT